MLCIHAGQLSELIADQLRLQNLGRCGCHLQEALLRVSQTLDSALQGLHRYQLAVPSEWRFREDHPNHPES